MLIDHISFALGWYQLTHGYNIHSRPLLHLVALDSVAISKFVAKLRGTGVAKFCNRIEFVKMSPRTDHDTILQIRRRIQSWTFRIRNAIQVPSVAGAPAVERKPIAALQALPQAVHLARQHLQDLLE